MAFMTLKDDGLIKAFVERGWLPPECARFILDVRVGGIVKLYTESYAPNELQDVDLASLLTAPEKARKPPPPPPSPPPNETTTRGAPPPTTKGK